MDLRSNKITFLAIQNRAFSSQFSSLAAVRDQHTGSHLSTTHRPTLGLMLTHQTATCRRT
jgi:hypothetical protein